MLIHSTLFVVYPLREIGLTKRIKTIPPDRNCQAAALPPLSSAQPHTARICVAEIVLL